MTRHTRREFVAALAALSAAGVAAPAFGSDAARRGPPARPVFAHGVASGDPRHDRVILWTRVTPADPEDYLEGRWQIARDPGFRRDVTRGRFVTDITRDFTVKIDACDLEPGTTYYYRFESRGVRSPIGRTRTLPGRGVDAFRIAFLSCSNFPYGYFNAYARVAERSDLDLVLHLGDYLYEYPRGTYVDPALAGQRDVNPVTEILSLTDYRLRHAQYKTDPDLQEAHRQHAFVTVWDDHEVANDAWKDGAENHQPDEGDWNLRKRAAIRAYEEWMPIRTRGVVDTRIFRRLRIGDLADLLMLDTRLYGRDLQAAFKGGVAELPVTDPVLADPGRTLLGFDQEAWLAERLVESQQRGAPWRILGQQVMMAQLSTTFGATIINPDQWDGYGPARARLYDTIRTGGVDGVVVLTGDIHSSWCNELTANPWDRSGSYAPGTGRGAVGVEFVCPAVTSPSPVPDPAVATQTAFVLRQISPHVRYVDLIRRGYGLLDIDRERVQGELWHVSGIGTRASGETLGAAFVTPVRTGGLVQVASASAARAGADPAPAED